MTYLPKNGSEDENADQAEELEVRFPGMFAQAEMGLSDIVLGRKPWFSRKLMHAMKITTMLI